MKKTVKKIIRFVKVLFGRHIPTYSYCEDEALQEIIKSVFDTCTFIAVK